MARLPTPSISGDFNAAGDTIEGTVTWSAATNLSDLARMRVRLIRILTATSTSPPTFSDFHSLRTRTNWTNKVSAGRTYQYKDLTDARGLEDMTEDFSEGSLGLYNVWGFARLEPSVITDLTGT